MSYGVTPQLRAPLQKAAGDKIGLGKLAMKHVRSISFAPSNPGPAYGLWMAGNALTSARYHVKAARRLPEGERWGRDRKLAAALAELAEAEATYARTHAYPV